MKKLMLLLGFFAFISVVNVSAQCCASKKACAKKTECSSSATGSASVAAESSDMVKKVGTTTGAKACCAKGEAKSCHGGSAKLTDATAPKDPMQVKMVKASEEAKAPTANQK